MPTSFFAKSARNLSYKFTFWSSCDWSSTESSSFNCCSRSIYITHKNRYMCTMFVISDENIFSSSKCTILQAEPILLFPFISLHSKSSLAVAEISNHCLFVMLANLLAESFWYCTVNILHRCATDFVPVWSLKKREPPSCFLSLTTPWHKKVKVNSSNGLEGTTGSGGDPSL